MDEKNIRIVFMGTPEFAVSSLDALMKNGYRVVGVITAPDKPAGRGKKVSESAVKKYAVENGMKVLQPVKLKDPEFLSELRSLQPDLQVVVAFRMLPEVVWDMPRLGTFNLHASLLPQYRGAAPLNRAVINGETETGVTTFLLNHEIDSGKILFREKMPIGENETAGEVHDLLMVKGAALVLKTVDALASGKIDPLPQDDLTGKGIVLKTAPKIFKEDCRIDWSKDAEQIRNLIRGLSPSPGAWTSLQNKESRIKTDLKIFFAEKELTENLPVPGSILSDGKHFFKIACRNGWIKVTDLQLAGKKRMKTDEFLRGFKNPEDYFAE